MITSTRLMERGLRQRSFRETTRPLCRLPELEQLNPLKEQGIRLLLDLVRDQGEVGVLLHACDVLAGSMLGPEGIFQGLHAVDIPFWHVRKHRVPPLYGSARLARQDAGRVVRLG